MLRAIKSNIPHLDNRQLVDTMFALGKLHCFNHTAELYKQKCEKEWANKLFPFFDHLINDFLVEATERVTTLG